MAKRIRQIIKIDEENCNGCGACVIECAEGALQVINGKACLVLDKYCDGLGACLGKCPQDAISFVTREADEFDKAAPGSNTAHNNHHEGFSCPSARTIDRRNDTENAPRSIKAAIESELRQWPIKLCLVNPNASYFDNADILLAADCVPFAYGSLHPDYLRDKTLVTGCPKFDDIELYTNKLYDIVQKNNIRRITVLQMEVPCCSGMQRLAEHAVLETGKDVPIDVVTVSLVGEIKGSRNGCCIK